MDESDTALTSHYPRERGKDGQFIVMRGGEPVWEDPPPSENAALRARIAQLEEALARVRALCEDLQAESVVPGEMADVDTLWPSDVLDAITGRGPRWEDPTS
jgi:hypothetical protein